MPGIETIAKGDGSRIVEARRFIVRDQQAFTAIWAAHAGPEALVPTIDFETRMVAAVFAGERPQPGYGITVAGTRREGELLVVVVEEQPPDPGVISAQILSSPFHVVTLDRDDGEVRFSTSEPEPQFVVFKRRQKADPELRSTAPEPKPTDDSQRTVKYAQPVAQAARPQSHGPASSTGLTPSAAAAMAYLAGPFSGALLLWTERTSGFVRFHAWQALLGLGALGTAAVFFLASAFVLLIVSPTAFWVMLWLAAIAFAVWVVVWGLCLWNAYHGNVWKLPYAGDYAERYASHT
jgi:uncharacterized membrane protein